MLMVVRMMIDARVRGIQMSTARRSFPTSAPTCYKRLRASRRAPRRRTPMDSSTYVRPSREAALDLAREADLPALMERAAVLRDAGFGRAVSYSRKVFIPLTKLCRDVCHYCTFAQPPRPGERAYMTLDEAVDVGRRGAAAGCREALFTLGDKPELRYPQARARARRARLRDDDRVPGGGGRRAVFDATGLLPHANPGVCTRDELLALREVCPSQGLMLESVSRRLLEPGQAHHGSPDKDPDARLETMRLAGELAIPYTSRHPDRYRRDAGGAHRVAARAARRRRSVRAHPGDHRPELPGQAGPRGWRRRPIRRSKTCSGPSRARGSSSVPRWRSRPRPTCRRTPSAASIRAGINDWGGVSPVTPDHVNPEAPWPHLERLARETAARRQGADRAPHGLSRLRAAGRRLGGRAVAAGCPAGVRRRRVRARERLVARRPRRRAAGGRSSTGCRAPTHPLLPRRCRRCATARRAGAALEEPEIAALFTARGDDLVAVVRAADALRREVNGDDVTYVVNRNINYTNVCYFRCQFCAFSKGKLSENLRGAPYDLDLDEVARRSTEAWERGCHRSVHAGRHPSGLHRRHLSGHLPRREGGGARDARARLLAARGVAGRGDARVAARGFPSRAAGRRARHAAGDRGRGARRRSAPRPLSRQADVRAVAGGDGDGRTGSASGRRPPSCTATSTAPGTGPDISRASVPCRRGPADSRSSCRCRSSTWEAPIYLKGRARRGPTFRESLLMHAVARLALHPLVTNIQASWVKMGPQRRARVASRPGVNDLGGTLMNESITRAAGAGFGQELPPAPMEQLIWSAGRIPRQRSTPYGEPSAPGRCAGRSTLRICVRSCRRRRRAGSGAAGGRRWSGPGSRRGRRIDEWINRQPAYVDGSPGGVHRVGGRRNRAGRRLGRVVGHLPLQLHSGFLPVRLGERKRRWVTGRSPIR